MKIYVKESNTESNVQNAQKYSLNPVNIFDIKSIVTELTPYGVEINILPKRQAANNLVAIPVKVSYIGKHAFVNDDKYSAHVNLYVDYENRGAFAMSRGGADKQLMMLLASVANKHIREPFKFDDSIRNKI